MFKKSLVKSKNFISSNDFFVLPSAFGAENSQNRGALKKKC